MTSLIWWSVPGHLDCRCSWSKPGNHSPSCARQARSGYLSQLLQHAKARGPVSPSATNLPANHESPLERVVPLTGLHRDPPQRREFVNRSLTPKATVAGSSYAPEGHLRFVVDRRTIDVADSALDSPGKVPGSRNIAAEDGRR